MINKNENPCLSSLKNRQCKSPQPLIRYRCRCERKNIRCQNQNITSLPWPLTSILLFIMQQYKIKRQLDRFEYLKKNKYRKIILLCQTYQYMLLLNHVIQIILLFMFMFNLFFFIVNHHNFGRFIWREFNICYLC